MPALLNQLRYLYSSLDSLQAHDPEQELTGSALPLMVHILEEAKTQLPEDSTLGDQIADLMTVELIAGDETVRAADALVIVGQLIAVFEYREAHARAVTPKLVVLTAAYGGQDVTGFLNRSIANERISLEVSPRTFGVDPPHGATRRAEVKYAVGDREYTIVVDNGQRLELPRPGDG